MKPESKPQTIRERAWFKMKKPTPAEQKCIERFIKSEWEKAQGKPWPKGMTLNEMGEYQLWVLQKNEAKKAFYTIVDKELGISPSEIKKADHDPDWAFFWGIGAASNRDLKIEWVKNRLQKAIENNDLKFFIRFGNALKQKPRQLASDKVSFLLAMFWATPLGKYPPFSWFTDEALLEMLKILTGNEQLTFDQVRKIRQRLKLETKEIQIKGVERVGNKGEGFRFIWVDKAEK
jgi:hypothetical protein